MKADNSTYKPHLKATNPKAKYLRKVQRYHLYFSEHFFVAELNFRVDYGLNYSKAVFINSRLEKIRKYLGEEIEVENVATQAK